MTQNDNSEFSVMNMIQSLEDETSTSATEDSLFRREAPVVNQVPNETQNDTAIIIDDPFQDHSADMLLPTYTATEIESGNVTHQLENLTDEQTRESGNSQLGEMNRTHTHLEEAKRRLGIKHLNIPTLYNGRVVDCAASVDPANYVNELDFVLTEIIEAFPAAVVEWLPDAPLQKKLSSGQTHPAQATTITQPEDTTSPDETESSAVVSEAPVAAEDAPVTVLIDKTQVSELAFTPDELEKIHRSRSVELKIVENRDINYTVIDEPINDIDLILAQYSRKFNDRAVSLPASRYRCTVTGLSYPEIMDTYYTLKLNNGLDGEVRKWTIAYEHITNPSIGPFVDFDDFLQKTSYLDINYILWNILCASSMAKEIVSLDCQHEKCNTTYEWIYAPENLLRVEDIPVYLLDEMKVTSEANTTQEIMDHYNGSMLRLGNSLELNTSHFVIAFGHISAYAFLNEGIFAAINAATVAEQPSYLELVEAQLMTSIKYMLLPKTDGTGHYKVTDREQMKRVIHGLDEMDFQTIGKITDMMSEPYGLSFSINDAVCPKCKHRSNVSIRDISDLLFIISRSLETANVVLKN